MKEVFFIASCLGGDGLGHLCACLGNVNVKLTGLMIKCLPYSKEIYIRLPWLSS